MQESIDISPIMFFGGVVIFFIVLAVLGGGAGLFVNMLSDEKQHKRRAFRGGVKAGVMTATVGVIIGVGVPTWLAVKDKETISQIEAAYDADIQEYGDLREPVDTWKVDGKYVPCTIDQSTGGEEVPVRVFCGGEELPRK